MSTVGKSLFLVKQALDAPARVARFRPMANRWRILDTACVALVRGANCTKFA